MRVLEYNNSWHQCPEMRPKFKVTRDITRGTTVLKKGDTVYGVDNSSTFLVPFNGNVSLPLSVVEFVDYGDVRKILDATFR